jgi:PPK2 family polyphosphate:nucleotide phosphotransferase
MAGGSVRERLRAAGEGFLLAEIDARATPGIRSRKKAEARLDAERKRLAELQERLYAEDRRSLLLVLQGLDASGKDGTIEHVIGAVNPQGCRIVGFKPPTPEEKRHHFLWRIKRALPGRRLLGIFNRSHYEDVLVARVKRLATAKEIESRYGEINRFEERLVGDQTTVVKVCLWISPEEQRRRLLSRLEDPTKMWKFNPADLDDRDRWAEYVQAYQDAITRCSTDAAPWYVVPADRKWYRNWAVTRLLIETLEEMDPQYPQPELDLPALRSRLDGEGSGG